MPTPLRSDVAGLAARLPALRELSRRVMQNGDRSGGERAANNHCERDTTCKRQVRATHVVWAVHIRALVVQMLPQGRSGRLSRR